MRRNSPESMLEQALKITKEMDAQKLRYDLITYNALLSIYARNGNKTKLEEIMKTMEEQDIKPTIDSYNLIMEVNNPLPPKKK